MADTAEESHLFLDIHLAAVEAVAVLKDQICEAEHS
jgi:hypothetical protein